MIVEYLVDPESGETVLTRGSETIVAPRPFSDMLLANSCGVEGVTSDVPDDVWERLKDTMDIFKRSLHDS